MISGESETFYAQLQTRDTTPIRKYITHLGGNFGELNAPSFWQDLSFNLF